MLLNCVWCWRSLLRVPLAARRSKVNPKGNQSWLFIGRTDAATEAPILWSPDAMTWLTGRDPDVGKVWRQEEKGMAEDEMVGWHHWLNGHEFEQAVGNWQWTGKPAMLQSMGSQTVGHDWATVLNWLKDIETMLVIEALTFASWTLPSWRYVLSTHLPPPTVLYFFKHILNPVYHESLARTFLHLCGSWVKKMWLFSRKIGWVWSELSLWARLWCRLWWEASVAYGMALAVFGDSGCWHLNP